MQPCTRILGALGLSLVVATAACGNTSGARGDQDAGPEGALERAEQLLRTEAPLPPTAEVRALAAQLSSMAKAEGAGARAVTFHAMAAAVEERLWRVEHRVEDGKASIADGHAAGRDLSLRGACEASVRAAQLEGELVKDPRVTYTELYRVRRRSAGGSDAGVGDCAASLDAQLAMLAAYRPAPGALDEVDRALAREGVPLGPVEATARVPVTPKIVRIEQWTGETAARIVVHLDRQARYRVFDVGPTKGQPARTFVELDGVALSDASTVLPLGGIVSRITTEATTTGSRVGLDLPRPAYRRVFQLLEPYRIVVDVAQNPPGQGRVSSRTVSRVVLDPGHGGSDPGATGPSGLEEKELTLSIARRIAPALREIGIEVKLTRDDDRYVTLEERTAQANAFGADLFLSIHCNATEKATRHGIETYVLDTTTSDMAGRVAARENAASSTASNEVAQLLASMRLADQSTRSTRLAELLLRGAVGALASYDDVLDGGVHRAGFYVLVGARMPAVLFETGYISHAVEEQRLGSRAYQTALADAVVNAIKAYREGR